MTLGVLHVETGRHLYGGALQVLHLARGLQRRGVENGLLVPAGSEVASRGVELGIPVETFSYGGEVDLRAPFRIAGVIRRLEPDIVHLHSRRGGDTWGLAAAALTRVPAVITRRVDNPESPWLARLKYGRARHVIAISGVIEETLLAEGVHRDKLTRVYSAVEADEWRTPRDRVALEREFDIPPGVSAGAMVAQFIERKGHAVLLKALARMREHGEAPVVVLFGRGPLREGVEEQAESLGVASSVRFAGYRTDLPQWLSSFDFCVHPARMEGLGVAVVQAGAAGLPVVGAEAGGIPEVVADQETGLLVPPGDDEALAGAMDRIASDPDLARRLGSRARQRVEDRFSVDAMVEGNLAVYRRVLGTGSRGGTASPPGY